jgi:peptide-methionine (S)-S-oxide reductase
MADQSGFSLKNISRHVAPMLLASGAVFGVMAIGPQVMGVPAMAAEKAYKLPPAKVLAKEPQKLRVAIFAGGCFWGVEGVFSHVKGVRSVQSGYHGGNKDSATYYKVAYGVTKHAEAVRVVYDPKQVRYTDLLQIFFSVTTDPTQLNRQGPDTGPQYRNAIVPLNTEQAKAARAYIAQLKKAKIFARPIVTKIEAYKSFHLAEGYHQDFMFKNPVHPYIVRWDRVKVANLKAMFPQFYRRQPVRN